MAADEQLLVDQSAVFPQLRVLSWIDPLPRESLQSYARRMAEFVDSTQPCLIGGASFGGIVALEMARHLSAVGCLLIGSIRSPKELPPQFRRLRLLTVFGPEFLRKVASFGASHGGWLLSRSQIRRLRKLARPEASFVRWAICAVLNWKPAPASDVVPIYQIHGSADEVLPILLTRPDVVVAGGVHALTLFSPTEVNRFITDVIRATASR